MHACMRLTCGTDLESAETKTVTPDMRVASRSTRSTRASLYGETRGETVSFWTASGWEASASRLDLRSAAKTAAVTKLASRKPRRNVRSICRAPVAVDHASGSPTQPRSAPVGGGNGERTSCDVAWARGGPLAGARGLSRAQSALALGLMDGAARIIAGRRFRRGAAPARSGFVPSSMFGSSRKYGTWRVTRSETVNLGGALAGRPRPLSGI